MSDYGQTTPAWVTIAVMLILVGCVWAISYALADLRQRVVALENKAMQTEKAGRVEK